MLSVRFLDDGFVVPSSVVERDPIVAPLADRFAWDESQPIVIEIAAQTFRVTPAFRDKQWFATVQRDD